MPLQYKIYLLWPETGRSYCLYIEYNLTFVSSSDVCLTLRLRQWLPFSRPHFNSFSCMKIFMSSFMIDRNLLPRVQLTISQQRFRLWLGAKQATTRYLNQWWCSLRVHIFVTWSQWIYWYICCLLSVFIWSTSWHWTSCFTMNFQWKKRFREMALWACAVARVPGKLCQFA